MGKILRRFSLFNRIPLVNSVYLVADVMVGKLINNDDIMVITNKQTFVNVFVKDLKSLLC